MRKEPCLLVELDVPISNYWKQVGVMSFTITTNSTFTFKCPILFSSIVHSHLWHIYTLTSKHWLFTSHFKSIEAKLFHLPLLCMQNKITKILLKPSNVITELFVNLGCLNGHNSSLHCLCCHFSQTWVVFFASSQWRNIH